MNSFRRVSCLAVLAVSAMGLTRAAQAGDNKTLLMHFMPWFQSPEVRGYWGKHWTGYQGQHNPDNTDQDGLPDIYSWYHPLIGPYDSMDPDVLECQLLQMKLAGVDGVIVDWYGTSDVADYPLSHEATIAIFNACGELGMSFAVCYEDRTIEYMVSIGALQTSQIADHLTGQFSWLDLFWFHAPHYFKVDGRPLVLNFGPIYVNNPAHWNAALDSVSPRPNFFGLPHLWRGVNADGGFNWVYSQAWDGDPAEAVVRQRLNDYFTYTSTNPAEVIPSANSGFHDRYPDASYPYLDHRDGDTLRVMLDVGMDGPWDIVQLVTWNDYTEGTMIEPTHEFGYTFLEIIQQARVEEQGAGFTFTGDDLRLPAILFNLRKAGKIPDATLDQVAQHLADGETGQAAGLLALILGDLVTAHPSSTITDAGGTLAFNAAVSDTFPGLELRWHRDGVPLANDGRIVGADTTMLTISPAEQSDTGVYTLVASADTVDVATDGAIAAVRASSLGIADFNNDGVIDVWDLTDYISALEAATP